MNRGEESTPLLEVEDLVIDYQVLGRRGGHRAVSGVSLQLHQGRTLGLVGESGSGKSTIGRAVLGLVRASSGSIRYRGADITRQTRSDRRVLSREVQVIFQDPFSSLNPSMSIGRILVEPLIAGGHMNKSDAVAHVARLIDRVSLPADALERYPFEFSGGQRQRIAIARALAVSPKVVVCDEPTSALDLTTQAQVLTLMRELQQDLDVSYLFISHDLTVVRQMSHEVAVLRKGEIVESGSTPQVTANPATAYTQMLIDASPVPDPRLQRERRAERHALLSAYPEIG